MAGGEPALLGRAIHLLSIGTETKITDYCQGSPYQVTKEAIMEPPGPEMPSHWA